MTESRDAACVGMTEVFYSEDPRDRRTAISTCESCRLKKKCLDVAVERGEQYGVWGGRIFGRVQRKTARRSPGKGQVRLDAEGTRLLREQSKMMRGSR